MLFKYKGYDSNGSKIKSTIEANSLDEAKSKLKVKQIIYTKIKEDTFQYFGKISFKRAYKINPLSLAVISRDLSIYLQSGISLLNAIKLINERYKKDKKLNTFFESIVTFLDEGKNFHASLELQKSVILPEFYLHSIKISEDGGILQSVLIELSDFLQEQDKLNKQINSAMAYPAFILVVSIFMVGFMLSFIVPKITAIFDQYEQALPPITSFVISAGDFVNSYYQILIFLFFASIICFKYMMKKLHNFRYTIDTFLLKIPFIGSLIELGELSRFAYMNSILINSGVPIVQSFKLGANIIKNSVIKKLFEESSTRVVEGEKMSTILDGSKIYNIDIAFIQAIAIGEETSQLSVILQNLSQLYSRANKDKITIFLSLLEPMFMLIVGSIIGFIVVAMLLPIFSMNFG
ncbi:Type IV fimbrial assembly protein PilC [hydrothermal vent metagenome]|uniref:Type IV fimbrial assembly protein PilC n=1 Tax=hydrothermal vent metagenome TaxID=652676 RepID=A0A3B1E094_9ZZZZ